MQKLIRVASLSWLGVIAACATAVIPLDESSPPVLTKDSGTALPKVDASVSPPGVDAAAPPPAMDSSVSSCSRVGPSNVCGLDPQCDCQSGTCEVDQSKLDGTTGCVPAGSAGLAKACTATAGQCGQGMTCLWGVCRPYCNSVGANGKCSAAGTGICRQMNTMSGPILNFLVCSTDCTLTDPKSCGGTSGCIYDTANATTDCYPVGLSKTCTKANPNCAPGLLCAGVNNVYNCLSWCKVVGGVCLGGKTCIPLSPAVKVSGVEYGVCN